MRNEILGFQTPKILWDSNGSSLRCSSCFLCGEHNLCHVIALRE